MKRKDEYWFSDFTATWYNILLQSSDFIDTLKKKVYYRNIFTFNKEIQIFNDVNFGAALSLKIVDRYKTRLVNF